ncbi:MAG: cupin domain-containing protein [Candidatus Bathyarchaeota archaeon]|nr:cupin domain-containing protein [Candidatus Bathyarchaeota archaeon]MDH5779236.1 cupin domain-containing protein [Candidatus Bathyarchaeota archaeon]
MKVCISEVVPVEMLKGIFRRTLAHNDSIMLVHFEMKMGSKVPAHSHKSDQVGIVLEGEMQLFIGDKTYQVKKERAIESLQTRCMERQ